MESLWHILLNPQKAERHPLEMTAVGFFYTSLSLWLAVWVFPDQASIVMVFFTVISCLFIVQGAIILEEKKESNIFSEGWLLQQHLRALSFFMFLFLGFLLAFSLWVIVLPHSMVTTLFSVQEGAVDQIQTLTGNVADGSKTASAISPSEVFGKILTNNLRVLILSLLFAVFYGAGAIFILAWNASVMGFVIGELARYQFGFPALPLLFARYFLHGIPEMLAYFIAALAGGIIFISSVRGDFRHGRIKRTLIDTSIIIAMSIGLLVVAAVLEVYVSVHL